MTPSVYLGNLNLYFVIFRYLIVTNSAIYTHSLKFLITINYGKTELTQNYMQYCHTYLTDIAIFFKRKQKYFTVERDLKRITCTEIM
jgi:hypothetical protein